MDWDWLRERLQEHQSFFWWTGGASLLILILSALAVPVLIRRIPPDYFLEDSEGARRMRQRHPAIRVCLLVLKNLLGAVLLLGGFIMLFTPGQGLLTCVVGLLLLNFPGKRRFERWLVSRPPIYRAISWMRKRAALPPLRLPERPERPKRPKC